MKNSAIQWTDHTFNSWEGCTKVAPECKNCYAETLVDHRFGRAKWGKGQPRRRTSAQLWKQPLLWNAAAGAADIEWCDEVCAGGGGSRMPPVRPRVFCLSLGDWLDEEVPIEWLADLLELIAACKNLDWQLLTKRPQNWHERICAVHDVLVRRDTPTITKGAYLTGGWLGQGAGGIAAPDNIWIGVSAGADQKAALEIPAKVHFLSCEPMLHALDTKHAAGFDWIIFGGESGKNARPCDVSWIRDGLAFCKANHIAAFVKQFGAKPFENHQPISPTPEEERNWGRNGWCKISFADGSGREPTWNKNYQLKDSHGGDMNEWPEDLRVREFPKS